MDPGSSFNVTVFVSYASHNDIFNADANDEVQRSNICKRATWNASIHVHFSWNGQEISRDKNQVFKPQLSRQ